MIKTIASRATFYDVIGYLVPGCVSFIVGWLWFFSFAPESALWLVRGLLRHGITTSLCAIPLGYVAGHLVNSLSSIVLEKWALKSRVIEARQWYDRMLKRCPERAELIEKIVNDEFGVGVSPRMLTAFDMRIRMEERMPNATVTGFSFLSFYGMSRTLAFLMFLSVIPICLLCGGRCGCFCCSVIFGGITMLAGLAFVYQYLRFVENYYDYLGSTLMLRTGVSVQDS